MDELALFASAGGRSSEPLAARMRPRTLEEFVGQDHILGPGRLLTRAIQLDRLSSVIFSGPPGTGKTTLARVIANSTSSAFLSLNAVLSGVKDVRDAIEQAKAYRDLHGRKTILFVDEVHRWNKAQQDALLPWVENGTFILIGATTENPFFEVNSALVSRSRIFQLKPLGQDDLRRIARMALSDPGRGYGAFDVRINDDALEHLVKTADGDARNLLGALELAVETTPPSFPPPPATVILIDRDTAEESIQKKVVLYDKEGDYHYDAVSAFIKSLRGSDPDAALYWLARMLHAGEEPRFIFRRLLILACEDIGLAEPLALTTVQAAAAAFDRVGLPEGHFMLAHAVLFCATSAKSNSSLGFFDALKAVEEEKAFEVPAHLRDASRDAEGFGHGKAYLYPHAYRDHWVAQDYLPAGLKGRVFYHPGRQGYEAKIRDEVLRLRQEQLAGAAGPEASEEILTFSPRDAARERWMDRAERAGRRREKRAYGAAFLDSIRAELLEAAGLRRHELAAVVDSGAGLLALDVLKQAPEGGVWVFVPRQEDVETLRYSLDRLDLLERPFIAAGLPSEASPELPAFDAVLGFGRFARQADRSGYFAGLAGRLKPGGRLILAEAVPAGSTRLSGLPGLDRLPAGLAELLRSGEELIYGNKANRLVNWSPADLERHAAEAGLKNLRLAEREYRDSRLVSARETEAWFAPSADSAAYNYGNLIQDRCSPAERETILAWAKSELAEKVVDWKSTYIILSGERP